jgi:hypothetical protein
MRSNGLTASTYSPVADLEPQVAETLLDDLRAEGVAAYTKPVESSTVGGFDRPEFRTGVKERLYVDSAASERVRDLIAGRDPGLIDDNDDLRWAQLVAGFDRPLDTTVAPWPSDEDVSTHELPVVDERDLRSRDGDEGPPPVSIRPWGSRNSENDGSDDDDFLQSSTARSEIDDDDDDDSSRFVPEPPPPLPQLPPYKMIAWVGLLGGPLLLVLSAILRYQLPSWASGLAVIGFIGGFITLVATLGDDDDDPWRPDNGAVV